MKKTRNNKNVFDEIDREIEQFNREHEKLDKEKKRLETNIKGLETNIEKLKKEYTEIRWRIKQQRKLNKCMKIFTSCIVLLLVLLTSLICLSMFKGQYEKAIILGIMGFFLVLYNLVFLKIISKYKQKKEKKDE